MFIHLIMKIWYYCRTYHYYSS